MDLYIHNLYVPNRRWLSKLFFFFRKIQYARIIRDIHGLCKLKIFPHTRLFGINNYSGVKSMQYSDCRMTSRKIQLLVNLQDMKKYDWKKKVESFRFWRLILLLHWNVWALDTHPFPALALTSISRILPSIPHKLLKSAIRSHNRT